MRFDCAGMNYEHGEAFGTPLNPLEVYLPPDERCGA
jgi:hypothetical protein